MSMNGVSSVIPRIPNKGTRVKINRRRTKRIIDFGISNVENVIASQIGKRNWNISDHVPIELKINMEHKTRADVKRVIFDRDLLTNKRIISAITKNVNSLIINGSIENLLNEFNMKIQEQLKELKVVREIKIIERKAMLSKVIKKKIKNKNIIEKLVRSNKLTLCHYIKAQRSLKSSIKRFRRQRYLNYIKKSIEFIRNNDYRSAWKWLKNQSGIKRKNNVINTDLIDKDSGLVYSDAESKKILWVKHFSELSKKSNKVYEKDEVDIIDNNIEKITDSYITWDEIELELKSTRNYKAVSEDGIPSELYKIALEDKNSNFSKLLNLILNRIFIEGCCPKTWETGLIVPIFKKGDCKNTNNYRGITIINTMQKLLTKILAKRLQSVCEEFNLLKKEQEDFVKGGECMAQVCALFECCQRRKIRNNMTILCFLDLKKAYDMVSHELLIKKLKRKALGTKFINYIENMYKSTKMKVKIGNVVSEEFIYERGVRQGCPTSPLLFNIFIDDLLNDIKPIEVEGLINGFKGLMFADDTVIAAENFSDLKSKLNVIERWMEDNEMEVNPSKCGIMIINKENENIETEEIKYKNEVIPIGENYIYLGVDFNNSLDLKRCTEYRRSKGIHMNRILGPTLNNNLVPLEYKKMIVNNVIIPAVSYGAEVFGINETRIQKVKTMVDRSVAHIVHCKNFPRARVYEELDIKPIQMRTSINRVRGFLKWKNSNGIIKDLINTTERFKTSKGTWCKATRKWMKRFKMNVDNSVDEGKREATEYYVKRIKKNDTTEASNMANNMNIKSGKFLRKLEINKRVKTVGVNDLLKIRTGTFLFTNRLVHYGKVDRLLYNKCMCCKENIKEDMKHLFLDCSRFKDERRKFLKLDDSTYNGLDPPWRLNSSYTLSLILGGDCPASGKMPSERIINSINFLSAISKKRKAIIGECFNPRS